MSFILLDKFYEEYLMNDVILRKNYRVKHKHSRHDFKLFYLSLFDGFVFLQKGHHANSV